VAPFPRNLAAQKHQNFGAISDNFATFFPSKFGGPKTSKFRRDFGQLRDLIANVSGTQQAIVNRKTALQTTDIPAQANLIPHTLVHKRRSDPPNGRPSGWALPRI